LKKVRVEDAVGLKLAHDITEVIPGKKKDAVYRRGQVIEKGDIERLLDLGKGHVYVAEGDEKEVHEDEAGRRIALAAVDDHMEVLPAKEGRFNIVSKVDGLVSVDRRSLAAINGVKDVLFTAVPDSYPVKAGDLVAATRIIPLSISEELLTKAEQIGKRGIIRILPFQSMRVGVVVTGTEVASGRVVDGSARVEEKLRGYGLEVLGKKIVSDDIGLIRDAINSLVDQGAELIVTTGGLSVDPDDLTKEGVEATGAKVIAYGAPVFPGAMFLIARLKGRYILGAPACVYFNTRTVLDIFVPRVMAGQRLTAHTVRKLAFGGLCLHCPTCHYPNCFFGKGQ
jgi:molybdenum cofactor synthesis domain-containing protein